jgi:hypothetical protein
VVFFVVCGVWWFSDGGLVEEERSHWDWPWMH